MFTIDSRLDYMLHLHTMTMFTIDSRLDYMLHLQTMNNVHN